MNDHILKNAIEMSLNFISLESVKNSACVGQKTNKFEEKEVYIEPTQKC
jgi:hypothetical protein